MSFSQSERFNQIRVKLLTVFIAYSVLLYYLPYIPGSSYATLLSLNSPGFLVQGVNPQNLYNAKGTFFREYSLKL